MTICSVTVALISVLLILVGLPLLAWWAGGRGFWSRLRPGRGPDPWGDFLRAHRLSVPESLRVQTAVNRGTALDDDRLRRAAVDLAEQSLAQVGLFPARGSRGQRVLALLTVLWLALLVVGTVFAIVFGGLSDVPWLALVPAAVSFAGPLWRRRNLRRAIARNSGHPPV